VILRQLFDHDTYTYTYLLAAEHGGKAIIIDPVNTHVEMYIELCKQLNLELAYAIDTHTHADHITAIGDLRDATSCVSMVGNESMADCVSSKFSDKDVIEAGNLKLVVLHTPGHTDDSYSFYLEHNGFKAIFTGDTLLIRGSGRTDFQNGNAHEQYDSLFQKILKLPEDTLVYPAHDYKGWTVSTIKEERDWNPRLQIDSVEAYSELMANLKLANPKMMDIAVPANQSCGKID
jgi:glyoxylase-like metal-dependent hydrolase (beta-lactamase superfamily II)